MTSPPPTAATAPSTFHLLSKPTGATCNLDCKYCFYLEKENLYPGTSKWRMSDEVLEIFREQASMWSPLLDPSVDGWRDAVHTVKGASRGVGAFALGDACERAEAGGGLDAVLTALDQALLDIAAYSHERALRSLRG